MRSWLRRRVGHPGDVEDIVQECDCRIAQLMDVAHVQQPQAYLVHQQLKAARIVRIEAMADGDGDRESDQPSPERVTAADARTYPYRRAMVRRRAFPLPGSR